MPPTRKKAAASADETEAPKAKRAKADDKPASAVSELPSDPIFDNSTPSLLNPECPSSVEREVLRAVKVGGEALLAVLGRAPLRMARDVVSGQTPLLLAIERGDASAITLLVNELKAAKSVAYARRHSTLSEQGTGEMSVLTLGYATGKVGAARGGRELNNALLDPSKEEVRKLEADELCALIGRAPLSKEVLALLVSTGVLQTRHHYGSASPVSCKAPACLEHALLSGNLDTVRFIRKQLEYMFTDGHRAALCYPDGKSEVADWDANAIAGFCRNRGVYVNASRLGTMDGAAIAAGELNAAKLKAAGVDDADEQKTVLKELDQLLAGDGEYEEQKKVLAPLTDRSVIAKMVRGGPPIYPVHMASINPNTAPLQHMLKLSPAAKDAELKKGTPPRRAATSASGRLRDRACRVPRVLLDARSPAHSRSANRRRDLQLTAARLLPDVAQVAIGQCTLPRAPLAQRHCGYFSASGMLTVACLVALTSAHLFCSRRGAVAPTMCGCSWASPSWCPPTTRLPAARLRSRFPLGTRSRRCVCCSHGTQPTAAHRHSRSAPPARS